MTRGEGSQELDAAACGLLTTTAEGKILAVNQTFLDWTGYARAELVDSRRLDELFTIAGRLYYETHFAPLLQIQGFVSEIASDIVCKGGRILPAFLNAVLHRDEEGLVHVNVAVFEGTQRRKYERELLLALRTSEQALKAKADFLAMFAHEIRSPLSALSLQIDLMERRGVSPHQEPQFKRLRSSVSRVLALVNNMLEVGRLDAGKVAVEDIPFEVRDVVQAVVHTLGVSAEKKNLPIHVKVDPSVPLRVQGDPVKLDHALTNLVGNAIKFTDSGAVTIAVDELKRDEDRTRLRFSVADTGIGIPVERQASIFEEYVQADATVARRFGGSGLGLAITKKLLDLLGSKLTLESEPGRGSTFSFELSFKLIKPS